MKIYCVAPPKIVRFILRKVCKVSKNNVFKDVNDK